MSTRTQEWKRTEHIISSLRVDHGSHSFCPWSQRISWVRLDHAPRFTAASQLILDKARCVHYLLVGVMCLWQGLTCSFSPTGGVMALVVLKLSDNQHHEPS